MRTYKIRKSFFMPLTLDATLLFFLFIMSMFGQGGSSVELTVLSVLLLLVLGVLAVSYLRQIFIDENGLVIKKLFREKMLAWEDVTNVDFLKMRRKVYLLLTTTKGFHILPNSFGNFTSLVQDVVRYADVGTVEPRVKTIIEKPVKRISDIVIPWLAALILMIVICLKLTY